MKRIFISVILLIAVLPVSASAIGFGGYYTMSFPSETYTGSVISDVDYENSFLGFAGKGWYEINRSFAIELAGNYSKCSIRMNGAVVASYPGPIIPKDSTLLSAKLGGRIGFPIKFLTPYVSAGAGLYYVSVIESRLDGTEDNFSKTYPGLYVGVGTKLHLFGPVSFDVSPTYSYVLGTGGEDDRMERLSTFDLNFGIAVDL